MRSDHNYIRTYTGGKFWPLDPRVEDVKIEDIAHALSNLCRFTGHTRGFYSVAQHSVHVAEILPLEAQAYGLLHDATEAYMADLARPLKHDPALAEYRRLEAVLELVICARFGVDPLNTSIRSLVKEADELLLDAELRDLMAGADPKHAERSRAYVTRIVPVMPRDSEAAFLARFYALTPEALW